MAHYAAGRRSAVVSSRSCLILTSSAIVVMAIGVHRLGHNLFKVAAALRAGRWPQRWVWGWGCLWGEYPPDPESSPDPLPAATTTSAAVDPEAAAAHDNPSAASSVYTSEDGVRLSSLPSPACRAEEESYM